MSILAKKSESSNLVNEEKNDNFLEITEYKENLEFEVLETFSDKISNFIEKNDYQKVIEFTEKQLYLLNQAFTDFLYFSYSSIKSCVNSIASLLCHNFSN